MRQERPARRRGELVTVRARAVVFYESDQEQLTEDRVCIVLGPAPHDGEMWTQVLMSDGRPAEVMTAWLRGSAR